MEENRIPKRLLYMNLGTTRLRVRPKNRRKDEVREDGRIVGEEGWQEKVHNRGERKKILRTARNRRILHIPMEWMNGLCQTAWELGYRSEGIFYSSIKCLHICMDCNAYKVRVKPLIFETKLPHFIWPFVLYCWKLQTLSSNMERLVNTCHSDCTGCGVCLCVCARARDLGVIRPCWEMRIEQGQNDNWRGES